MRYLTAVFFSIALVFSPLMSIAGTQSQWGSSIAFTVAAADAPTPDQQPSKAGADSSSEEDC